MTKSNKDIIKLLSNLTEKDQAFLVIKSDNKLNLVSMNISENEIVSLIEYCKARIIFNHIAINEGLFYYNNEKH